ncbi:Histidine kinase-, DNA gyrase B-, and HSP90-like ATPase [Roseateles sp. YR242]|uniref:sensor histidine kinase n=1 Tax=Roseateles sp. YR242 TaxID=1855305 RepID=UPI0008B24E08|nr:histidine kinase [Roseateles sp. YR242]SEK76859.1 Histidine kinase-, DNA gyrase B-, and HSP90-like ATPase [Roseateles sp. YR242]
MNAPTPASPTLTQRWQHFSRNAEQGFHAYASWLVSITWKRFVVLSVLLIIGANILQDLPPFSFSWRVEETSDDDSARRSAKPAKPPKPAKPTKSSTSEEAAAPAHPAEPASASSSHAGHPEEAKGEEGLRYEIQIDGRGVRIVPRSSAPASGASAASDSSGSERSDLPSVDIRIPNEKQREAVREAVEDARRALQEAAEDARQAQSEAEDARRELEQAKEQAEEEARDAAREDSGRKRRYRVVHLGDFLDKLAVIIVLASALLKATYKGRIQAEAKAAQATETAEAESLRRQVVEARMAAMQAQVEPHFLFNTLASIDHLIETDPPRASQMQRNLIALLRASMPTMREANANGGVRELAREMAVIRPYLDILQMRMEERLQPEINVPDGLLSAEFPPMMIQGLVENAIKHGLEPKAEGGSLKIKAEVVHGKLSVTVADTGLGFGRAATAGTGVGLANIRERLSLLYGKAASVTVAENQPSGTVVTITVPYRTASTHQEQGVHA